jgi:hypothetical protein
MTEEDRRLADRIGDAFTRIVAEALAADDLGSFGELAAAISDDIETGPLTEQQRGERWLRYIAMSLGYWLDLLVSREVESETGATEQQVLDVSLLREWLRRRAAEGVDGILDRRGEN